MNILEEAAADQRLSALSLGDPPMSELDLLSDDELAHALLRRFSTAVFAGRKDNYLGPLQNRVSCGWAGNSDVALGLLERMKLTVIEESTDERTEDE